MPNLECEFIGGDTLDSFVKGCQIESFRQPVNSKLNLFHPRYSKIG